ncbi:MAG: hypothetical protein A4S14_02700 [Proteobacteria bacterium SG_bin9]|nr:MAG: hypothetical protein A4S14_02700 [Proteobacteria bacterium SG_bin9]
MRAVLLASLALSLWPFLSEASDRKIVDPTWLKECTSQTSLIDKPFDYIEDCSRAFPPIYKPADMRRFIKICEQQKSDVANWCRDRLRGSNDPELTDQIRKRALVIRVLQDLLRQ